MLTTAGWRAFVHALPGHLSYVRELVFSKLSPVQVESLPEALDPIVAQLDPQQRLGRFGAGSGD